MLCHKKQCHEWGGGLIVLDVFVHCLQSAKAKARVQGGRRSEATQESQIMSGDVALSHSQPRPVRVLRLKYLHLPALAPQVKFLANARTARGPPHQTLPTDQTAVQP